MIEVNPKMKERHTLDGVGGGGGRDGGVPSVDGVGGGVGDVDVPLAVHLGMGRMTHLTN